ncbi:MAG: hypothetical protein U1E76_04690 [Planctomycetota bacterium]
MRSNRRPRLRAMLLALATIMQAVAPGCATIFRGTSQPVRVATHPTGGSVLYQGMPCRDGQLVSVNKRFETPQFLIPGDHPPFPVDMAYDPDPWLIGDAALCLLFVIPGLVAFGVDFATGSWRNLHDLQTVAVPDPPEQTATR